MAPKDKTENIQDDHSGSDDYYDDRPLVSDLLDQKSDEIEYVRNCIQSNELYLANKARYDDIWILRFVLSHKSKKSAAEAALKTILFRDEEKLNELGDIRHSVGYVGGTSPIFPAGELLKSCCEEGAIMNALPDVNRGLITYIVLPKFDMNIAAEKMDETQIRDFTIWVSEAAFQIVDGITRETGRLTKQAKFIDLQGMKLKMFNRTYLKRESGVSKELEDFYPQLLGSMCIFNSPTWIHIIWNFMRPILPRRTAEKVDFLPSNPKNVAKSVLKQVSEENLPEIFGGKNSEWPPPTAGSRFSK